MVVAFRNNANNTREMWNARACRRRLLAVGRHLELGGLPLELSYAGAAARGLGGGKLLAVWSARGAGNANNGTVYASTSTNGGTSWTRSAPLSGFVADEPPIAVGSNGHIFVTGVTGNQKSSMIESLDGGSSWSSPAAIQVPDGAVAVPQPDARNGVVVVAGVSAAKTVWLERLE